MTILAYKSYSCSTWLTDRRTEVYSIIVCTTLRCPIIRRFTVELSPNNPEPKHTPDSFVFTCTTHIVEELHKNSELNHEAIFCVENVPISVYK